MAPNFPRDLARLKLRVDQHHRDIKDLQSVSASDHETVQLQDEGLQLLRKLGENHTRRLTRVEQAVARIRRRIRGRLA